MKSIFIGAFIIYLAFSVYEIQTLKNKNRELSDENIVLNTVVVDQNNTIKNLIKIQEYQMESLKNLDKNSELINKKYKKVEAYVKDTNETNAFLHNFNNVIDRLWNNDNNKSNNQGSK